MKSLKYSMISLAIILSGAFWINLRNDNNGYVAKPAAAKERAKNKAKKSRAEEDLRLDSIHHVATKNGTREFELYASSARHIPAEDKTILQNVSATFFLDNGNTVHVSGNNGELLASTKNMIISGEVVAKSGVFSLRTEKLRYDEKMQSIYADTRASLAGQGMLISSNSMVFDFNGERTSAQGRVQAQFDHWSH